MEELIVAMPYAQTKLIVIQFYKHAAPMIFN